MEDKISQWLESKILSLELSLSDVKWNVCFSEMSQFLFLWTDYADISTISNV